MVYNAGNEEESKLNATYAWHLLTGCLPGSLTNVKEHFSSELNGRSPVSDRPNSSFKVELPRSKSAFCSSTSDICKCP